MLGRYLSRDYQINDRPYPIDTPIESRGIEHSNGQLNMAKYYIGQMMNGEVDFPDVHKAKIMLEANREGYSISPLHKSHDNFTGMVALAKCVGHYYDILNLDPKRRYHPRARIYWSYMKDKNFLAYLGLPFVGFANLFTAYRKYKVRNGRKIFKSDNEFLMILMYQSGLNEVWFMRIFGYLCHKLLVRKYGDNIYRTMVELFHNGDPEHPIRESWEKIDEKFKWWSNDGR